MIKIIEDAIYHNQLKMLAMEVASRNDLSGDFRSKAENSNQSNYVEKTDELICILNSIPKENMPVNCQSYNNELQSESKNLLGRNQIEHEDLPKPEQRDILIDSNMKHNFHNFRKVNNGDNTADLTNEVVILDDFPVNQETRLDRIPKDILWKYGIVLEDNEGWKNSSETEHESDGSAYEEGRLEIDEDNEIDLPNKDSAGSQTVKENTSNFTNCGHHLVISSVVSLSNSITCNICTATLSDANSLELHQKGHCTFQGCFDFIEDPKEMERHLNNHNAHPTKPFRCDNCRKRFHYYRFAEKHRKLCKALKKAKCPYCKYTSFKMAYFNKHVAKHMNNIS